MPLSSQPAPPRAEHISVGLEAVDPYGRVYAPLVMLGWIAGWTERIGLGTSIVLVPLHNPMHLAKEVATLQELSGGRFTLGVGMGWHRHEFDFMGIPFEGRGREGNRGASVEEADRIAAELALLVGGTFTDRDGRERRLGWEDVLVVTPYNAQVRCLRARLGPHARIGTVDKFQGQEAPVVFFSMATSSGDDLPRNLEFLFSRNRLNVAISRAQSLAALVASPQLLEIRCRTIEQMRMVNALCRFVEEATGEREVLPLS